MVKRWQRSSNGPDWVDIRMFMVELARLHRCSIYLETYPDIVRNGPCLRLVLTAVSNEPGTELHACEESVAIEWPNRSGQSYDGAAYALCVKLDHVLLDKWWKQEVFTLP